MQSRTDLEAMAFGHSWRKERELNKLMREERNGLMKKNTWSHKSEILCYPVAE
jgi:hypothetical protein